MAAGMNRQILLKSRPEGAPSLDNFELAQRPMPEPADGEVLIRTRYLSLDPYMRGRMNAAKSTPGRSGSASPWWAAPSARSWRRDIPNLPSATLC
jgi:NADPH-dependent curcumin reductase